MENAKAMNIATINSFSYMYCVKISVCSTSWSYLLLFKKTYTIRRKQSYSLIFRSSNVYSMMCTCSISGRCGAFQPYAYWLTTVQDPLQFGYRFTINTSSESDSWCIRGEILTKEACIPCTSAVRLVSVGHVCFVD